MERVSVNVVNILALQQISGIGAAWVVKHIKGGESCGQIVEMVNATRKSQIISVQGFTAKRERVLKRLARESASFDFAVAFCDDDWSYYVADVRSAQMPLVLFCRGNVGLLRGNTANVAVIGTQTPEPDSSAFERVLVEKLTSHNVCIVSGLAYGCDSIAHQVAVDNIVSTIAFLPSPLSNILPMGNRNLAEQIVANGGLLVSEYCDEPESRYELNGRYAERDRLQAMFSRVVVLASGYQKNVGGRAGGSRLAMRYAKEYGRLRAVVYDNVLHAERLDFGLNRDILTNDSSVISIDERNIDATIDRIVSECHKNSVKSRQFELLL